MHVYLCTCSYICLCHIELLATVNPMTSEGSRIIKVSETFYVKLTIWDTAGMERMFNMIPDKYVMWLNICMWSNAYSPHNHNVVVTTPCFSMHCAYTFLILHTYDIQHRFFRDVNAALIVFDINDRSTFVRAVSDQSLPNGTIRKSWFKEVNHRGGDTPPVKILGM